MNIFCSKKGHQIYPLEIERIDKNGNIFVRSCKECDEEISDVAKQRVSEYMKWRTLSSEDREEIGKECEEGECFLEDVIDALKADGLADAEILNRLEQVRCSFWSIERLV